ncbi:hypothetical protein A244_23208 [Pseudomonas syringae pv. actinidiae ICMP 18807]|uniref:Uncharacterized protein n=2 Tax=Pseudomonas syringae TaxID=317 RepID=S6TSZ3_PSESF|nr:hypothetical protein A244_23208 [Pseudomonas syringae pv. actinidiae ICMP 18807]
MWIVERLSLSGNEADAQAALKMRIVFHADEDKLTGYSDAMKAGRIVRAKTG